MFLNLAWPSVAFKHIFSLHVVHNSKHSYTFIRKLFHFGVKTDLYTWQSIYSQETIILYSLSYLLFFFYSGHNFLKPSLLPRLSRLRSNSHLCSRVIATSSLIITGEASISTAVRARILDQYKSCYVNWSLPECNSITADTLHSSLTNGYQASVWGESLETGLNEWWEDLPDLPMEVGEGVGELGNWTVHYEQLLMTKDIN